MLSSVFKITKYANARTDCIVVLFLTSLVFMNVRVYVEYHDSELENKYRKIYDCVTHQ